MSAIASKAGTSVATFEVPTENAATVSKTLALVLGGKSRDLTRMSKSVTDGERAALIETGRYLAHVDSVATTGLAVICYTLLTSKAVESRSKLAEELGVSAGRITQVMAEGTTLVELGDPSKWGKHAVPVSAIRKLSQGSGSKELRQILESDQTVANKRIAIATEVDRQQTLAAEAKAKQAANRAAEAAAKEAAEKAAEKAAKSGKNGAPEVSQATSSTDVTAEVLALAVQSLAEATDVLTGAGVWERLDTAQQQMVSRCIAKITKTVE